MAIPLLLPLVLLAAYGNDPAADTAAARAAAKSESIPSQASDSPPTPQPGIPGTTAPSQSTAHIAPASSTATTTAASVMAVRPQVVNLTPTPGHERTQVDLHWTFPDDPQAPVAGWVIEARSLSAAGSWAHPWRSRVFPAATRSATLPWIADGVMNDGVYEVRVVAVAAEGQTTPAGTADGGYVSDHWVVNYRKPAGNAFAPGDITFAPPLQMTRDPATGHVTLSWQRPRDLVTLAERPVRAIEVQAWRQLTELGSGAIWAQVNREITPPLAGDSTSVTLTTVEPGWRFLLRETPYKVDPPNMAWLSEVLPGGPVPPAWQPGSRYLTTFMFPYEDRLQRVQQMKDRLAAAGIGVVGFACRPSVRRDPDVLYALFISRNHAPMVIIALPPGLTDEPTKAIAQSIVGEMVDEAELQRFISEVEPVSADACAAAQR